MDQQGRIIALQVRQERDFERLFTRTTDSRGNVNVNFSTIATLPEGNSRFILEKNSEEF